MLAGPCAVALLPAATAAPACWSLPAPTDSASCRSGCAEVPLGPPSGAGAIGTLCPCGSVLQSSQPACAPQQMQRQACPSRICARMKFFVRMTQTGTCDHAGSSVTYMQYVSFQARAVCRVYTQCSPRLHWSGSPVWRAPCGTSPMQPHLQQPDKYHVMSSCIMMMEHQQRSHQIIAEQCNVMYHCMHTRCRVY